MPTPKFVTLAEDAYGKPLHYFVSSVAEWRTGTDLLELIAHMQHQRYSFNAFRVDLPDTAHYQISGFKPVLPDDQLHWIGFFEPQQ